MKLTEYLGVSAEVFQENYINAGLVDTAFHPTFPLVIFTYSRKCVAEQVWDTVTTKCRGLIANTDNDEIAARPFEKFFNYGDPQAIERTDPPTGEPETLYEKMDGFMCTLYTWAGKSYIASKGSFDSPHAKWATAMYNNVEDKHKATWPEGYTIVFEGITKNLRIVVDYGDREELVLIGMINIATGEELNHASLRTWATANGFKIPESISATLQTACTMALDPTRKNVEGYVAYWSRPGMTPFRLKIKYQDYLRIHRLVTGVSPKRVFEALQNGWTSELDEWTDSSTPWFNAFVSKWRRALTEEYEQLEREAKAHFALYKEEALEAAQQGEVWTRKQWAIRFMQTSESMRSILFAMLDGKDVKPFIWKRIKPMISGSRPMVDAAKL